MFETDVHPRDPRNACQSCDSLPDLLYTVTMSRAGSLTPEVEPLWRSEWELCADCLDELIEELTQAWAAGAPCRPLPTRRGS